MWHIFRRFVIFMIRKRMGLKKFERFMFKGQKQPGVYHFTEEKLIKDLGDRLEDSGASLNWLLDPECEIVRV